MLLLETKRSVILSEPKSATLREKELREILLDTKRTSATLQDKVKGTETKRGNNPRLFKIKTNMCFDTIKFWENKNYDNNR